MSSRLISLLRTIVFAILAGLAVKVLAEDLIVSEFAQKSYDQIKEGNNRFSILRINDANEINVESLGPRDATYDEFLNSLMRIGSDECRFGLFQYRCRDQCETLNRTIVLLKWCSKSAKTESVDSYSKGFPILKGILNEVTDFITADSYTDVEFDHVKEALINTRNDANASVTTESSNNVIAN